MLIRKWKHKRELRYGLVIIVIIILFYYHFSEAKSEVPVKSLVLDDQLENTIPLVVLVMTGPKNYDRRRVMRDTWLSGVSNNVRHFFVLGSKNQPQDVQIQLNKEQAAYQDLLVLDDFEDSYHKLTEKLALMLEWTYRNLNFQYVLKADDDTYARLDVISKELKNDARKRDARTLYWVFFTVEAM